MRRTGLASPILLLAAGTLSAGELTDKVERYVRESCGLTHDEVASIRRLLGQDENNK